MNRPKLLLLAAVAVSAVAACVPQPPQSGSPTPTTAAPATTTTTVSTTSTSTTSPPKTTTTTAPTTTTTAPPPGPGVVRVTAFADAPSSGSVVSRNGRWVVFTSTTTALGVDRNGAGADVFRWDRTTGTLARVTGGNDASGSPTVADDGTVAFESAATDLAGTDRNGSSTDVFVWVPGSLTRVTSATYPSSSPVISADGTRVVLHSYGDLAGPGSGGAVTWTRANGVFTSVIADTVGHTQLPVSVSSDGTFVLVDDAGTLTLAQVGGGAPVTLATATFNAPITYVVPTAGVHAVADDGDVVYTVTTLYVTSTPPGIGSGSARRFDRESGSTTYVGTSGVPVRIGQSSDGRHVVTTEVAVGTGFAPSALGNVRLLDRQTNAVTLLSGAASAGTVSATGRYVALDSNRTDLAGVDGNGTGLDVFLRDRGN